MESENANYARQNVYSQIQYLCPTADMFVELVEFNNDMSCKLDANFDGNNWDSQSGFQLAALNLIKCSRKGFPLVKWSRQIQNRIDKMQSMLHENFSTRGIYEDVFAA